MSTLAVGDPGNNFHSMIRVNIRDFYNGYAQVEFPVTVKLTFLIRTYQNKKIKGIMTR